MIQGNEAEYIIRIIKRGDRAAPTLVAIPVTPNVPVLGAKNNIQANLNSLYL